MYWKTYRRRIELLLEEAKSRGFKGFIVSSEDWIFFFTGFRGPGILVAEPNHVTLCVPALEYSRAYDTLNQLGLLDHIELDAYNPYSLPEDVILGVEPPRRVYKSVDEIIAQVKGRGFLACSVTGKLAEAVSKLDCTVFWRHRMVKEPWELERIMEATRITCRAIDHLINELDYGVSELEAVGILESYARSHGAWSAFKPIIAFGRKTAYPHAEPTLDSRLAPETPVTIDAGFTYNGYCSDITRSWWAGEKDNEYKKLLEAIDEAINEAIDTIQPGIKAGEVDKTARNTLKKHGLDKYFTHSLGHGLGILVHEEPRIAPNTDTTLEEGMVFTIEPGVYIHTKYGARIEEVVTIGPRKAIVISSTLPRIIS